jgi:DNA polymerase-3 subunit gamma/tau
LLLSGEARQPVQFISNLAYQGRDLYQFQRDFLEYLRKVMLLKIGSVSDSDFTTDIKARMADQAAKLPLPQLVKLISIFQKAGAEVKYASIPSLPLELASVESVTLLDSGVQPVPQAVMNATPAPEVASTTQTSDPDALAKVVHSWPQILEKIKTYNHSLLSSLKLAAPVALEGTHLVVVFPYKFHQDAIDAPKNRIIVDQVLEEVMGRKMLIRPILGKDWAGDLPDMGGAAAEVQDMEIDAGIPDGPQADAVSSAIKIMGGQVDQA